MPPKLRVLLAVLGVSLLLDQGSKLWTVHELAYRGPALDARASAGLASLGHSPANPAELVVLPNALEFVHAQNPAAAMGMMLGFEYRLVVFAVFTLVAVGVLGWMYRALAPNDRMQAGVIGLLLSGALGNAIDRMHKGTVTDFIKVIVDVEPLRGWMIGAIGTNEWYTFNIADAAIFVGVGLYLVTSFMQKDGDTEDAGASPLEPADA
ncbi:MAG: signal peptidase II [Pseudomonadota bacterium]|nr:signal peptidase II [Pseudomonadota bacterium]